MNPIDWDDVVSNAEQTPRASLADWLANADDLQALVVIGLDQDGNIAISWCWGDKNFDAITILGMIERGKFEVVKQADRETA